MIDIKSNEKPEREATGSEKLPKVAKSNKEQQKAKMEIGAGKTQMGNKKPTRATKGTKDPNRNQA